MDFGDPRESLLSLDTPATWEADNRVEERYQWGAQLLDLCGLSPEDYKNSTQVTVKTIVDCGNCGGGSGSGETGTTENVGKCKIEGDIFYVDFDKAVESELFIFVTAEDAIGNEFAFETSITKGANSVECDVPDAEIYVQPFKLRSVKLSLTDDPSEAKETESDDKYKYSTDFDGDVAGKTYFMSVICSLTNDLSPEDYAEIINTEGESFSGVASFSAITSFGEDLSEKMSFLVPCVETDASWDELPEFYEHNSYDFILLTEKEIESISNKGGDVTALWTKDTVTINDITFNRMMSRDLSGAQIHTERPGGCSEDSGDVLDYTLKIKK